MRANISHHTGAAALMLGCLLLFSAASHGKTLYVDRDRGDDATSWADNGPSNPWRSIGRAAWGSANRDAPNPSQAAQAGDRVVIAAGTYESALQWTGGDARWTALYQAVNNGASGSPITFEANGTVAIRAPSWGGPVIGTWNRNFIVWSGPFLIDERYIRTVPDTGPVVLTATTGSGIDGATIHGTGALWADNHNGVRVEGCRQCFIRNTTIDNFLATSGYTRNGAAVMLYNSDDTLIEHNEFFGCATGIYIKGVTDSSPMERTIVRYNIIRNMSASGINLQRSQSGRIYQNILRDNAVAFFVGGTTDSAYRRPVDDILANNTIDGGGSGYGVYYNGVSENLRLRNNIYTSIAQAHYSDAAASTNLAGLVHENNVYHAVSGTFSSIGGASHSLSSWKSTFGFEQTAPASSTIDPLFVDAQNHDFRLQASSPARTLGIDLLDLDGDGSTADTVPVGAYVTGNESIGRGTVGLVRPDPPTNAIAE